MFIKNKPSILSKDEHRSGIPKGFHLEQNRPNPFSTHTTIYFSIPRQCSIKIIVYCRLEEPVSVLFDGQLSPGKYELNWDGTDSGGQRLKQGDYFYFLETEGFIASRRLTIKEQ